MTSTQPSSRLAQVGRAWFRWRGISPVPFFLLMILLPSEVRWSPGMLALFATLALVAEGVRIWAVGYMGSATRTRDDGVPALVHVGPLRYVRNPLYLANMTLYAMVGLLMGHIYLTLFLIAYTALQYTCIVAFEEDRLSHLFGSAYGVYQSQVSRWWISLTPGCRSSGHPYDLKKALRSERGTFLVIVVLLTAVVLKRTRL